MPGRQVKNWRKYHALRRKGHSKRSAAKITNAGKKANKKGGKKSSRKRKRKR